MKFSQLVKWLDKRNTEDKILLRAVFGSDYQTLQSAIAKGADVNTYDRIGLTPLLVAIYRGDIKAVELLLAAGADPNRPARGDPSATPLWHAAEDFGLVEIADLLRRAGGKA